MDTFFFSDHDELQFLWSLFEDPDAADVLGTVTPHLSPPPPSQATLPSSFSKFTRPIAPPRVSSSTSRARDGGGGNIHRRIIELLRRIRRGKQFGGGGGESSRGGEGSRVFRHMMRERQRRERLSQSYADLYAMLSPRTKADKNSIVQTAAALVRELKGVREGLQKRNEDLMRMEAPATAVAEGTSAGVEEKRELVGGEGRVITVRAESSTSVMDSVIGALRCLEQMDVKARAIRTEFAGGGGGGMIGGVMTIETNEGSGAVETEENMERLLAMEGWRSLK